MITPAHFGAFYRLPDDPDPSFVWLERAGMGAVSAFDGTLRVSDPFGRLYTPPAPVQPTDAHSTAHKHNIYLAALDDVPPILRQRSGAFECWARRGILTVGQAIAVGRKGLLVPEGIGQMALAAFDEYLRERLGLDLG